MQPAAPAQKQQGGKKGSGKIVLIVISAVVAMALLVTGAALVVFNFMGKDKVPSDPNAGVYQAVHADMWGVQTDVSGIWENGFSIELMDKGKCKLSVDGKTSNGKWTLDGERFTVSGGGFDSSGTLKDGVLTLENVMDMGLTLTFLRDGAQQPGTASNVPGVPGVTGIPGAAAENSGLMEQWNGTWYGVFQVVESNGEFAAVPFGSYDAYLLVKLNQNGEGTFEVYIDGAEQGPFAAAYCTANENALIATQGSVAGYEMNAGNWMFLPMPAYPDQYCMGDRLEKDGSALEFMMFFKPWGASWGNEKQDGAMVPPSLDKYEAAIAEGKLPPMGEAPAGYDGTIPADTVTETPSFAYEADTSQGMEGDWANTIPGTDGKVTRKDIQRADAMLVEGYERDYLDEITYEMVRDKIGEEGQACDDDPTWWNDTVHTYCWYSTSDDTTLTVSFDVVNGRETTCSAWAMNGGD